MPVHMPIYVFSMLPVAVLLFHYPASPVFIICAFNCIPARGSDPVVSGTAQALELNGSSYPQELAVSSPFLDRKI